MNDVAPGFCKMTAVDTPATANRTNAPVFTTNRNCGSRNLATRPKTIPWSARIGTKVQPR